MNDRHFRRFVNHPHKKSLRKRLFRNIIKHADKLEYDHRNHEEVPELAAKIGAQTDWSVIATIIHHAVPGHDDFLVGKVLGLMDKTKRAEDFGDIILDFFHSGLMEKLVCYAVEIAHSADENPNSHPSFIVHRLIQIFRIVLASSIGRSKIRKLPCQAELSHVTERSFFLQAFAENIGKIYWAHALAVLTILKKPIEDFDQFCHAFARILEYEDRDLYQGNIGPRHKVIVSFLNMFKNKQRTQFDQLMEHSLFLPYTAFMEKCLESTPSDWFNFFNEQYISCPHCQEREGEIKFQQCSKCKKAYYCSKECQVADWKRHKKSCRK